MEEPRADKVAVVDEVREKFQNADAVLLTEYRGLTVSDLTGLRRSLAAGGGEYHVYKNTLVRFAAKSLEIDLDDQLTGPTALAFISQKADGTPGDIAAVAKVITDFAKGNPLLVLKGGVLGEDVLDASGAKALASLPTAAEIYARLAGALNSGSRGLASVVSGVHRSIALVLQAAIDAGAFAGDAPVAEEAAAPAVEAEAAPVAEDEEAVDEAPEPVAAATPETEETDNDDAAGSDADAAEAATEEN